MSATHKPTEGHLNWLETPHHHLVCRECRQELELPARVRNSLREVVAQEYGFRPCLDHFVLFGVCRDCQEQGDPAPGA